MRRHRINPARRCLAAFVLLCAAVPQTSFASASTAPTAGAITPQQADLIWRKATEGYAPARAALVAKVKEGAALGPFRPDWASLRNYREPAWFDNAKFGIFVHWGVYAVPAFANEWYPRNMYDRTSAEYAHQVATYGSLAHAGLKDFIPQFRAEHWDPKAWATLFRQAGARYVVGVAEHTDGFAMYDSKLTRWTAVQMGPRRDVMAALGHAVKDEGLRFGLSTHRAEHTWFFDHGREIDSDVNDPAYADFYGPAQQHISLNGDQDLAQDWTYVSPAWVDDWMARTAELEAYYHPDLIYLDWWVGHPSFRNALAQWLAYYYNAGATRGGVVVNYKLNALPEGSGTLDVERGQLGAIRPQHWQTDTSISNGSWGYVEHDTYRPAVNIVRLLADVVSKNGNLLLDVGPKPDGSITPQEQAVLHDIGAWLAINGTAIYDTQPWRVYGEGPTVSRSGSFSEDTGQTAYTSTDFRFTQKPGKLFAIEMAWPESGSALIKSITSDNHVRSVRLLGTSRPITWRQTAEGLAIGAVQRPDGMAIPAYEIDLDSTPDATTVMR